MSESQATGSLAEALLAVQTELPTAIHKDAENPHFHSKYVTLDALLEVARPALNKHGIVLMQWPERADDGELVLTTRLTHTPSLDELTTSMVLLPPKNDPQGQGSAITYARRYSLMAILGLAADDDDDGNAGSQGERTQRRGGDFKVTPKQIEKFILPSAARKKLSDADLHAILKGRFGVERVEDLPRKLTDELVKAFDDPVPALTPTAQDSDVPPDTDGLDQPPLGDDDVPWER